MAKSKHREMDLAMAEELGRKLSPFMLTIKHVIQLNSPTGGFCFGFHHQSQIWYDPVEIKSCHMGLRVKPARFLLPNQVATRLAEKKYARWYFFDRDYLYPLQQCRVKDLYDQILFVNVDVPHYRSSVVVTPDKFQLRKKPLRGMCEHTLSWDDCTTLHSSTLPPTHPVPEMVNA